MPTREARIVSEDPIARQDHEMLRVELLGRLERVRTRFAVACAAEAKVTSSSNWIAYAAASDRARRCAKLLRRADFGYGDGLRCLEALRAIPCSIRANEAGELSRRISEAVSVLLGPGRS